jgi:hypothetical protein
LRVETIQRGCSVSHLSQFFDIFQRKALVPQIYWVGPLAAGLLTSAFYRFVFGVPPVQTPVLQEIDQGVPLTGVGDGRDESNMK